MSKSTKPPEPSADSSEISVSVACALADRAFEVQLEVTSATNIREAVRLSGIAAAVPELNIEQLSLGIYGCLVAKEDEPHTFAQTGDRIEIYRPLLQNQRHLLSN